MLTAYPSTKTAFEAYELGAVDYIEKTVEGLASLPAVVQMAVERHQRRPWWQAELAALLRDISTADGPMHYKKARRRFDALLVRIALERSGQNKRAAARRLGVAHGTLYSRLRER